MRHIFTLIMLVLAISASAIETRTIQQAAPTNTNHNIAQPQVQVNPNLPQATSAISPAQLRPIKMNTSLIKLPNSIVSLNPGDLVMLTDDPVNFIMAPGSPCTGIVYSNKVVGPFAVADINNDQKIDMVLSNNTWGKFQKGINNGRGLFQFSDVTLNPYPTSLIEHDYLSLANVTGDQSPDLVMVSRYCGDHIKNIRVYTGKPDGTFDVCTEFGSVRTLNAYTTMMDTNNDGRQDLTIMCPDSKDVIILNGNGSGFLPMSSARRIPINITVWESYALAPATNKEHAMLYMNNPVGSNLLIIDLATGQTLPTNVDHFLFPSVAGDLNGDGLNDIISIFLKTGSSAMTYHLHIYMKNNFGGFDNTYTCELPLTFNRQSKPANWIKIADFNKDGHPDIVVPDFSSPRFIVLLGDGVGNFVQKSFDLQGTTRGIYSVNIADVNKDSYPDLVLGLHGLNGGTDDGRRATVLNNITNPDTKPQLAVSELPTAYKGMSYQAKLTCIGGKAPLKYSIAFGGIQQGLSLNPTTGVISGTLSAPHYDAWDDFGITVTDAAGRTHSRDYQIYVSEKPVLAVQYNGQEVRSFNFGRVTLPGTVSAEFNLKLMSTHNVNFKLNIYSVKVDNPAFVVDYFKPGIDQYSSGAYDKIKFHFTPTTTGVVNTTMHITTNIPETPVIDIALSGEGYRDPNPNITIDKSNFNFPDMKVGSSSESSFTIGNIGAAPLVISRTEVNTTQFSLVTPLNGVTIPGGGTYQAKVRFSPQTTGYVSGNMNIYSNSSALSIQPVYMGGRGLP